MNEEKIEKGTLSYEEIKNIRFGETVYSVKIIGNTPTAKKINDEVILLIRKGTSHDKRYEWYPNWSLSIRGENDQLITWTPTRNLFEKLIGQVFIHEEMVDRTRTNRERDVPIWKKKLEVSILSMPRFLLHWIICWIIWVMKMPW